MALSLSPVCPVPKGWPEKAQHSPWKAGTALERVTRPGRAKGTPRGPKAKNPNKTIETRETHGNAQKLYGEPWESLRRRRTHHASFPVLHVVHLVKYHPGHLSACGMQRGGSSGRGRRTVAGGPATAAEAVGAPETKDRSRCRHAVVHGQDVLASMLWQRGPYSCTARVRQGYP